MKHVIKAQGHTEPFESGKIEQACIKACADTHITEADAQQIASHIVKDVEAWMSGRSAVTSEEIFEHVMRLLGGHSEDAANQFKTYRDNK